MYLSCYNLDISCSEVRRALRNSYEMHRTVMSVFQFNDSGVPRKDMSILYRLVTSGRNCKLYVSSESLPLRDMPAGFNKEPNSPKDIDGIFEAFSEGRTLCFDLMAMPSKKVKSPDCKNSKRVYLGKEAEREEWLYRKAEQNGFEILSFTEENATDNKLKNEGYQSIVFKGVLRIMDKEKFCNAYKSGIGAEKAFGCGMLLLSKPLQ